VTFRAIAVAPAKSRSRIATRVAIGVTAVVLFTAVVSVLWVDVVSPRVFPKRFGVVVEHAFYRSGRIHPSLLPKVLDRYGIDDIVALTYPASGAQYQSLEAAVAAERGIRVQSFALDGDGTGDPATVVDALVAIHESIGRGDQVLVHCAAGSERTGAVVYLYRTLVLGESADSAYAELLRYGHRPARNPKLEAFLNANMAYFADALVARGVVPERPSLPHLPEPTAP
jgi:protein tyrosine/serine phosphatase